MLVPRQPVPSLRVPLVGGSTFDLANESPEFATMLVFYRGLHCPICATYLKELERLTPEFNDKGVTTLALSSDDADRAEEFATKIRADNLRVGHSLSLSNAKEWGLYISEGRGTTSIGIEEPAKFSEPGLFLIKPDGTLYYGNVQTMPFARPDFKPLLGALDFVKANNYPARGEYTGSVA